jgi:hypothetical protein
MNLTLSVDDEVVRRARIQAQTLGSSVNQLVRDYLETLAGKTDPTDDIAKFERLWSVPHGNSCGWKFNRDEIYERR